MFDQFCTFNTMWDTEMLLSNAQQFFKYLRASGYSPLVTLMGVTSDWRGRPMVVQCSKPSKSTVHSPLQRQF